MSAENSPVAASPEKVVDKADTPLAKLTARLADITRQADHHEMWGVELSDDASHAPTQVVLQKFLRANSGDVAAAEKQLVSALEWRKKMQPAALVTQAFDKRKFGGLGFVTTHKNEAGKETVVTWNIYGSVKDNKATFGDVREFIKWRAAVMELSVQQLCLNDIKEPIPENGTDEYRMIQVHDYRSVSFFRMDPDIKAASKETISVFSMAYPELLAHKYFVNVPAIMGWMFGALKLFLSPATLRKFHPMTSGTTLAAELKDISSTLPKEFGGNGPSVQEGMTLTFTDANEAPKQEASTPETKGNVPVETKQEEALAESQKEVIVPVEAKEETVADSKEEETLVEDEKDEEKAPVESTTEAPVAAAAAESDAKPAEEATAPTDNVVPMAEVAKAEIVVPVVIDTIPEETEAEAEAAETVPKDELTAPKEEPAPKEAATATTEGSLAEKN